MIKMPVRLRKALKKWIYGRCPGFAGRFSYFGTYVYFPPGAEIFYYACEQGIFEKEIVRMLTRLVQPGTVFLDVGANIGLMALPVLRSCPACRVVSFEPSINSLPFLQRTVRESAHRDRWMVIGKALSNRAGELDFCVGDPKKACYEGFKGGKRLGKARTVKVPASTLDEEWRQLGKPSVSVIKIDIEGAEGLVLEGGGELLDACRPQLLVEWDEEYLKPFGTPPEQLVLLAEQLDYRIFSVPGGIPVSDARSLRVQMMFCSNFLLMP